MAEGVETANKAEICNALGFDYSQGYFFSKPAAVSTYTRYARRAYSERILILRKATRPSLCCRPM